MKQNIRDIVLSSLSAIGANHEAKFYADLFAAQDPERFALVVIDQRCLKNPLLESLIGNLQILASLGLTPILLVGALDEDNTSIRFQSQRLTRDIGQRKVGVVKLDVATYGLIPDIRKVTKAGKLVVLEMTGRSATMNLASLAAELQSNKIVFLQPSGGLSIGMARVGSLTLEQIPEILQNPDISAGQARFLKTVVKLEADATHRRAYVIASPLNLLSELFTTKGSGTLIRRRAKVIQGHTFDAFQKHELMTSIEAAFAKPLGPDFFDNKLYRGYVEAEYRGGAILLQMAGLPYLSKFWVSSEARGEGIGSDIWDTMTTDISSFFWRSRMNNPFNDWYVDACDGMQIKGDWRVFWKGLEGDQIPQAIEAAGAAPDDFLSESIRCKP